MQASACSDLVDLAIANPGPVALHNLCIFDEISRLAWAGTPRHCEEQRDEAIQTVSAEDIWIASLRSQ
jgi:hypothetical protein